MPTIVAASESQILFDGQPVEGVRSIEYRHRQERASVYALGSTERIGVVSGPQVVDGVVRVASTEQRFNALTADHSFQIVAQLRHGSTTVTVSFDECFLSEKSFALAVGEAGEAAYAFSARRVREEVG